MDDLSTLLEGAIDDHTPRPSTPDRRRNAADSEAGSPQKTSSRSGGFGFAAIREKASIQDRLVEKCDILIYKCIFTDERRLTVL
jgi:hypothetical protein